MIKVIEDDYEGPAAQNIRKIGKIFDNAWKGTEAWENIRIEAERAINIDPKCYPAYIWLGMYEYENKNYDKMEEYFFKGLEVVDDPHNPDTWDSVIITIDDGMKDFPRLVRYLKKFYEKKPEFFVVRYLVTTLWKKLNNVDEALAIVNSYLQLHPDDKKALKLQKKLMKVR